MGDLRQRMAEARDRAAEAQETGKQIVETVVNGEGRIDLPAPDVDDSGIAADLDVPVHVAWSRVMGEVQWVAKADRTTSGSTYNYRGVDRVVDSVAPAIRKHGVIVMPVKVTADYTVIQTKSGSSMNYCRAKVAFAIIGPHGDVLSAPNDAGILVPLLGEAIGEGFDTGDKSSMKAQSVALREFYIKALAIPVTRPAADPERGEQHEIAGPRTTSAEEYAAEIQNEATSVNRLQQIKAELFADRRMGTTEVELFSGETVRLVDLVQRVGRERVKK